MSVHFRLILLPRSRAREIDRNSISIFIVFSVSQLFDQISIWQINFFNFNFKQINKTQNKNTARLCVIWKTCFAYESESYQFKP